MKKRTGRRTTSSRNRNSTTRRTQARRGQNDQQNSGEGMENSLHELFLEELADIYNAEHQLIKALPKMAKAAESDELRQAFEDHLQETQNQISRLDEVFQALGEAKKRKVCKAMQGLIEEGKEIMEEQKGSNAIDAALIAAAQKIEHYEIATYGTLCTWAEQMGHNEALDLLKQTIDEEEAADEKLTQIAESMANQRAEQGWS
jgi:ferritin-like metal-binding protein YciE